MSDKVVIPGRGEVTTKDLSEIIGEQLREAELADKQKKRQMEIWKFQSGERKRIPEEVKLDWIVTMKSWIDKNVPVNIRQCYYILLTLGKIPIHYKASAYSCIVSIITKYRKKGIIPWSYIIDPGHYYRGQIWHHSKGGILEYLDEMKNRYRRDFFASQKNYILILCEKESLTPIVWRALRDFDYQIPLGVTKGKGGWGAFYHDVKAGYAVEYPPEKYDWHVLTLFDWDTDGEICEKVCQRRFQYFGIPYVSWNRIALTDEQAERVEKIPIQPNSNAQQAHFKSWIREKGAGYAELEALDPYELQNLVREEIKNIIDLKAFMLEKHKEEEEKESVRIIRRMTTTE